MDTSKYLLVQYLIDIIHASMDSMKKNGRKVQLFSVTLIQIQYFFSIRGSNDEKPLPPNKCLKPLPSPPPTLACLRLD